jgi:hypothetical protein
MEFCLLQIKINNKNQRKAPGVQITQGAFLYVGVTVVSKENVWLQGCFRNIVE